MDRKILRVRLHIRATLPLHRLALGWIKMPSRSLADSLYLNSRLDLELPTSKSSFDLDSTTADALVMQTSIGQGDTLVTPMEMALIASAVAK